VGEMAGQLDTLRSNEFTPVTITGVRIDAKTNDTYLHYTVGKVEVKNTAGKWVALKAGTAITAKAGAKLQGRVQLTAYAARAAARTVEFTLAVPKSRAGSVATLGVSGGLDCDNGSGTTGTCDTGVKPTSFAKLLSSLQNQPKNDQIRAALVFGESTSGAVRAVSSVGDVVTGGIEVPVRIKK
ncbi:MAG TPA: hypothetical protein VFO77_00895, partial [Actinoplanes sp.]|nr:hypothetical protein [Actinoplanes sp.]